MGRFEARRGPFAIPLPGHVAGRRLRVLSLQTKPRVHASPVLVAVGFSDTTCSPCPVYAAYNEIKVDDNVIGNGMVMTHSCTSRLYTEFGDRVKKAD